MSDGNILIIEDDYDISNGLRILLEREGYFIEEANTGVEGIIIANKNTFDLIILDIMLPDISGIDVCKEIRKQSYVPILFLTVRSTDYDKYEGLSAGGDDYLVKPFSFLELKARVNALIRRNSSYAYESLEASAEVWITIGSLSVNKSFNKVKAGSKDLYLTEKEYQILLLLMQNPGRIFTAEEIYTTIWNEIFFESAINTVMVHIKNLRSKMDMVGERKRIRTVWGQGYCIR